MRQANLLTEQRDGRFHQHDLIAAYTGEFVNRNGEPFRRADLRRLCDHYLHTVAAGARLLEPRRELPAVPEPVPGTAVPALGTAEEARDWFAAHHPALLTTVHLAAAHALPTVAWKLA